MGQQRTGGGELHGCATSSMARNEGFGTQETTRGSLQRAEIRGPLLQGGSDKVEIDGRIPRGSRARGAGPPEDRQPRALGPAASTTSVLLRKSNFTKRISCVPARPFTAFVGLSPLIAQSRLYSWPIMASINPELRHQVIRIYKGNRPSLPAAANLVNPRDRAAVSRQRVPSGLRLLQNTSSQSLCKSSRIERRGEDQAGH